MRNACTAGAELHGPLTAITPRTRTVESQTMMFSALLATTAVPPAWHSESSHCARTASGRYDLDPKLRNMHQWKASSLGPIAAPTCASVNFEGVLFEPLSATIP